jgi:hypothetical protein
MPFTDASNIQRKSRRANKEKKLAMSRINLNLEGLFLGMPFRVQIGV